MKTTKNSQKVERTTENHKKRVNTMNNAEKYRFGGKLSLFLINWQLKYIPKRMAVKHLAARGGRWGTIFTKFSRKNSQTLCACCQRKIAFHGEGFKRKGMECFLSKKIAFHGEGFKVGPPPTKIFKIVKYCRLSFINNLNLFTFNFRNLFTELKNIHFS